MDSKIVVITGGTAGIGRATVHEFARNKYTIAVLARDKRRLNKTVKEARKLGSPRTIGISVDVANPEEVEFAINTIEKKLGSIDIWINNAMATVFSPIATITPEEYKRSTEVTYLGSVYATLGMLKRMRKRDTGTIVQVGSALAYRAIPLQAPYCGAKFALRGFMDSLRTELLHDGIHIHVTMVQLPAHNTPQFSWARSHMNKHPQPVPPIYQPEVAARAIYWAANHKRREVWVGKSSVAAIIINKFFPSLADRYLAFTGYDSQLIDIPKEENWPGNLFEPVRGDFSVHGIFNNNSKDTSLQFAYEKIPFIHTITDTIFAIFTTIGMLLRFRKYGNYRKEVIDL